MIKTLVAHGAKINVIDEFGNGAIHFAAIKNKANTVQALLENGAKFNAKNNIGETPSDLSIARSKLISNFHIHIINSSFVLFIL